MVHKIINKHKMHKNHRKTNTNDLIDYVCKTAMNQVDAYDFSIQNFYKILDCPNKNDKYDNTDLFLFIVIHNSKLYILYKKGDNRKKRIISIFTKILKELFSMKNLMNSLKNIKSTFIPFYVSDTHFYHNNDLPFFVEARPENKKGILYPDQNFYYITMTNNIVNYDQFKSILQKDGCDKRRKLPIVFFRGANTGADKHNIRMKLKDITETKQDPRFEIHVREEYLPMTTFCDYKYLLNLPGHQPWSYRFSKILAMDSLVFNVSVLQSYDGGKSFNQKWIQFFDEFFINGKDYVEIDYPWIEDKTGYNDVSSIYNRLSGLYNYYQTHTDLYKNIVKNARQKTDLITMDVCDFSIKFLLIYFTKKFNEVNDQSSIEKFIQTAIHKTPKDQIKMLNVHLKSNMNRKTVSTRKTTHKLTRKPIHKLTRKSITTRKSIGKI